MFKYRKPSERIKSFLVSIEVKISSTVTTSDRKKTLKVFEVLPTLWVRTAGRTWNMMEHGQNRQKMAKGFKFRCSEALACGIMTWWLCFKARFAKGPPARCLKPASTERQRFTRTQQIGARPTRPTRPQFAQFAQFTPCENLLPYSPSCFLLVSAIWASSQIALWNQLGKLLLVARLKFLGTNQRTQIRLQYQTVF